jgi:DNA-binding IclR family transcriptional regulator
MAAGATRGSLSRGLAVLQCLVGEAAGLPLHRIADAVDLPKSGAHRILTGLIDEGFVQQQPNGDYALTLRIVSLGLRHLASSTIFELAVPILVRLANESGQLVRLSLIDGDRLLWVSKAQGARAGLRYDPDPDHGGEIQLDTSASGLAWMSQLSDDEALRLMARQGRQERQDRHPLGGGAPKSLTEVLERVHRARERGWAHVHDSIEEGISAMAAPLVDPHTGRTMGVVSIAGPSLQLTDARMADLAPHLQSTVAELSGLAAGLSTEVRTQHAAS